MQPPAAYGRHSGRRPGTWLESARAAEPQALPAGATQSQPYWEQPHRQSALWGDSHQGGGQAGTPAPPHHREQHSGRHYPAHASSGCGGPDTSPCAAVRACSRTRRRHALQRSCAHSAVARPSRPCCGRCSSGAVPHTCARAHHHWHCRPLCRAPCPRGCPRLAVAPQGHRPRPHQRRLHQWTRWQRWDLPRRSRWQRWHHLRRLRRRRRRPMPTRAVSSKRTPARSHAERTLPAARTPARRPAGQSLPSTHPSAQGTRG